jgi:hypothetical protein
MRGGSGKRYVLALVLLCSSVGLATGLADLADVYLHNGLALRGVVTSEEDGVVLRNVAGEMRIPASAIERVELVSATEATITTPLEGAPAEPPAPDAAGERAAEDSAGEAADDQARELEPAPLPSKEDIQRLRLHEMVIDEPPEEVRVQFLKRGRQQDLPFEVLEELQLRGNVPAAWEETLQRGQPHEKAALILRETGMQHADRIRIMSDPEVFRMYRRSVLPLVNQSCARSGCHAGTGASVFRFPIGSKSGERFAYGSFILLDQLETAEGQVIDRGNAEDSLLLRYMLPQDAIEGGHPDVGRGPQFRPVIATRDDPAYLAVVDWINFLVMPRPDYNLEYENPYRSMPPMPALGARAADDGAE